MLHSKLFTYSKPTTVFASLTLLSFMCLRIFLIVYTGADAHLTSACLLQMMWRGLLFDSATLSFALIPAFLWQALLPMAWRQHRAHRFISSAFFFIALYSLLFICVAEYFFWDEFGTRFNFIAVDYLIYSDEVIANINESYPVAAFLVIIGIITTGLTWYNKNTFMQSRPSSRRWALLLLLTLPALAYLLAHESMKNFSDNRYQQELAGNGVYDFFYAFNHNELDYREFYSTKPTPLANNDIQQFLNEKYAKLTNTQDPITRHINHPDDEQKLNVMLIVVESLSAKYLGVFGDKRQLTPNLDQLARESLFFTNLYATGTRTVRGLEAVSLSIPPTPGQSIVRRPHNEGLRTLGTIFREHGYDARFLYGGYGYFDNMNNYFSRNDFTIVDRAQFRDAGKIFANAWGIADEDLFNRALKEADQSVSQQHHFFNLIMTTSNHRPYTYPDGRIDIPSGKGRQGAVKYTDFAIGQFIRNAKQHAWFNDTVFVIVADHCAGSAGKSELPVKNYHIPMFIYAPLHIKPQTISTLASQIDLAPTLLAQLHFDYDSTFFGRDILTTPQDEQRAFISTYQALGLLTPNELAILWPEQRMEVVQKPFTHAHIQRVAQPDQLLQKAISLYQSASDFWLRHVIRSGQAS